MRFSTVTALITAFQCGTTEAKVSIAELPKTLSHEHADAVGQAHTEAFEMLSEKYSDPLQRPKSQADMMKELGEIMASFCDHEPTKESCQKIAMNYEVFTDSDGEYPDDFDDSLLVLLDDIYTSLNTLQEDNVDEVLAKLDALKAKMKDVDAHPIHKHVAMSGAAVAIESTKLWTKVYSDSSHPLFGLHQASYYAPRENANGQVDLDPMHGAHRRLDESVNCIPPVLPTSNPTKSHYEDDHWIWIPGWGWAWIPFFTGEDGDILEFLTNRFDIIDIIQADIDGAIFGFFNEADSNPVVAINPILLFTTVFVGATTRSASWASTPPTPAPTDTPSFAPSISCAPTQAPSVTASESPSSSPTLTMKPSTTPTSEPSIKASASPSTASPTVTATTITTDSGRV